jgi:hypothetical protein
VNRTTIRAGLVHVRARCYRVLRAADRLDEDLHGLPITAAEQEFRQLWRLAETGEQAGEMLLRQAEREGFVGPPGILRRFWRRLW